MTETLYSAAISGGAKRAFGIVGEGRDASQDAQLLEEDLLGDFRIAAQRAGKLHRSMAALVIGEGGDETDDDENEVPNSVCTRFYYLRTVFVDFLE